MLYSGTDPESYITEYTLVYNDKTVLVVASPLDSGSTVNEFSGVLKVWAI